MIEGSTTQLILILALVGFVFLLITRTKIAIAIVVGLFQIVSKIIFTAITVIFKILSAIGNAVFKLFKK